MIRRGEELKEDLREEADTCIVGSGAGGSVLAEDLAGRGARVLVLEEGGYFVGKDFHRRTDQALRQLYKEEGMIAARGNAIFPVTAGRCVGGSTVINSAICFRAPEEVLDGWRQAGALTASTAEVAAAYQLVEERIGVAPSNPGVAGRNNQLLAEALGRVGWSGGYMPRNAPACAGCGVCQFGCPTDAKQSMVVTFVPAASTRGARFLTRARVERIEVERNRVRGVVGSIVDPRGRTRLRFQVQARTVVLCAGALGSPVLLEKSGLAGASGELGRNLCLHPGVGLLAEYEEEVRLWQGIPQGFYSDQFHRDGILIQSYSVSPDAIYVEIPESGRAGMAVMARYRKLGACGAMIHDGPNGRVRPGWFGRTDVQYRVGETELARLRRAVAVIGRLLFAAGAKRVYTNTIGLGPFDRPEEIDRVLRGVVHPMDLPLYASHPMGSCRMGRAPRSSVVSPSFETHDVRGLFVVDASVFPTSLGVNPQVTVMVMARLAAPGVAASL